MLEICLVVEQFGRIISLSKCLLICVLKYVRVENKELPKMKMIIFFKRTKRKKYAKQIELDQSNN